MTDFVRPASPETSSAGPAGRKRTALMAGALLALAFLPACSLFSGLSRKPNPELAKAGRLSLASAEEIITPAEELAQKPIELPAPVTNPDWAQPGGRADGLNGNLAGPGSFETRWRVDAGAGTDTTRGLVAPPIMADGRIFVLDSEHVLRSFDAQTGARGLEIKFRASFKRDKFAFGGGLASGDGKIFVVTGYGGVIAIDAKTGAEIWKREFPAPFQTAPLYLNDRLYVIANDSELLALNARTGTNVWGSRAIAEPARVLSASSPAGTGDIILAPFPSGELVAYLPANGRRLWSDALTRSGKFTPLSEINDIAGRPVIDRGLVFAASQSGVIVAIDLRTGDRKWEKSAGSIQTPAVVGDYVFALTIDSRILAMDRESGKVYWAAQLRRFDKEKKRKGRITWTGPLVTGGRLVVISSEGEMAALSPKDGAIVETRKLDSPAFIPPFAAQGRLYVLTDKAKLYAFGS